MLLLSSQHWLILILKANSSNRSMASSKNVTTFGNIFRTFLQRGLRVVSFWIRHRWTQQLHWSLARPNRWGEIPLTQLSLCAERRQVVIRFGGGRSRLLLDWYHIWVAFVEPDEEVTEKSFLKRSVPTLLLNHVDMFLNQVKLALFQGQSAQFVRSSS